jgi:hypothetical protein
MRLRSRQPAHLLSDVKVTGEGATRYAEGVCDAGDMNGNSRTSRRPTYDQVNGTENFWAWANKRQISRSP